MRFLLDDADYSYADEAPAKSIFQAVLTRFNMRLPSFREVGEIRTEDEFLDWLKRRIELFGATCLPSMLKQTRRPAAWFIGFDWEYRDRVAPCLEMIAPHDWIKPVWQRTIDGAPENARALFAKAVSEALAPEHDFVVTSRVDNDDAIARGYCEAVAQFVASVTAKADAEQDFWISFPFGAQLSATALRVLPQNNNAFLSRCEKADAFRSNKGVTALSRNHSHVFEFGKVYTPMSRRPMWLQCVHDGNVSNTEKVRLPELADFAHEARQFGVKLKALRRLMGSTIQFADDDELPDAAGPARSRARISAAPRPAAQTSETITQDATAPIRETAPMASPSLNDLGVTHGTDKASGRHDYLATYERYLEKFRHRPIKALELGVLNGASLRMWRDYFVNGRITGADINADRLRHAGERTDVVIGNCGEAKFLTSLADRRGPFDFVIDDASHLWQHQQVAFDALFPHVAPGGVYIIEDIHTSYHQRYSHGWPISTVDWLKSRIDMVTADRVAEGLSDQERMWRSTVNEVVFIRKSCLITKR